MKKKNIAWLLSAAMILTTASAPVETVSVYAAEEFQRRQMKQKERK